MLFRTFLITLLLYLSEADESETSSHFARIERAILPRSSSQDSVGGGTPGKDFPTLSRVPRTDFDCRDRLPGYYANEEYGCQVFHVCHSDRRKDSFLCPNGTVFHQKRLICDWWYNVDCASSHLHEGVNAEIGKPSPKKPDSFQQRPRPSPPSTPNQQQTFKRIPQRPQPQSVRHEQQQSFVTKRPQPKHRFTQQSHKSNKQQVSHRFVQKVQTKLVEEPVQRNDAIFVKKTESTPTRPVPSIPQHRPSVSRTPTLSHRRVKVRKRPVPRIHKVEEKTDFNNIGVPLPSISRRPVQNTQSQRSRVGAGRRSKRPLAITTRPVINNVPSPPRKPPRKSFSRTTVTNNFITRPVIHTTPVPERIFIKEEFPEITTHHPRLPDHFIFNPKPPKRIVVPQTSPSQSKRPQSARTNIAPGQRSGRVSQNTVRRPLHKPERRTSHVSGRRTSSRTPFTVPSRTRIPSTQTFGLRATHISGPENIVLNPKSSPRVSNTRRPQSPRTRPILNDNINIADRGVTTTAFRTQSQITRPNRGRVVITKKPLKRVNRPLHFDINDLDDFNDPFGDDRFDRFDSDRFDRFNDDKFDDDRFDPFDDDRFDPFDDDRFDPFDDDRFDRFDDDRFDDDRFDDDDHHDPFDDDKFDRFNDNRFDRFNGNRFDNDRFDDDRFDDDRFDDDRFDDDRFDDDRFDDDRFDDDLFDDDRFDDDRFDDDRFDDDRFDDDRFDDDRIFTLGRRKKLFKVDIDDRLDRFGNTGKFNFGRRTRGSIFSTDTHKSPSVKDSRVFSVKPPSEIQLPPPLPDK